MRGLTLAERVEAKADRSAGPGACHPWTGGFGQYGGPSIYMNRDGRKGSASARKVVWELERGPVPEESLVMVSCGNPGCVNTAHMFLKSNRLEDLFWPHVEKSAGCWLWTGYVLRSGYGQIFHRNRHYQVHRLSWELHNGPIVGHVAGHPELEWCVCHRCDNPRCVNPGHLFLGRDRDNNADMIAKGRNSRGPEHGRKAQAGRARGRMQRLSKTSGRPSGTGNKEGNG